MLHLQHELLQNILMRAHDPRTILSGLASSKALRDAA
jgi:hypothetical protein